MPFIVALTLLVLFTLNVVIAAMGSGPMVGNVAEMLLLLASAVSFTVGILQRETREKRRDDPL